MLKRFFLDIPPFVPSVVIIAALFLVGMALCQSASEKKNGRFTVTYTQETDAGKVQIIHDNTDNNNYLKTPTGITLMPPSPTIVTSTK